MLIKYAFLLCIYNLVNGSNHFFNSINNGQRMIIVVYLSVFIYYVIAHSIAPVHSTTKI